ncbi:uncharacterized protein [Watersipora subatra]|uniref:uncharacterized protein isoform X2 n=1 Tax=Watersipora subatra TaxID=2589382 RepID=UPI00355C5EAD
MLITKLYLLLLNLAAFIGCTSAEYLSFNFNPAAPEHVHAHMFTFGNGTVPVAEGPNPFANNALNGEEFFGRHLQWEEETIMQRRQERFGLDGEELMQTGQGVVLRYQISPEVNERAYMMNMPCPTPPEGHEVVDGGFQLFVTREDGVEVFNPAKGKVVLYPFQTNLVYSWLKIHIREEGEDCGLEYPPPEWIILRYQTLEPAKWTLNAIVFELEVIGENYFGSGRSLGISAPIVTEKTITNRLLNYMTFETSGPEAELKLINIEHARIQERMMRMDNSSYVDYDGNFTSHAPETVQKIFKIEKSKNITEKEGKGSGKPST